MNRRKEAGLTYAFILFLMAIMSSLGLSFIFMVGAKTSATMNRSISIQAQYLAESAANHAMWRLLNEPGFPAAENVYYMHSLGKGRYGYKVRKPTPTTFATVATVGAAGEMVVKQSYVQYIPSKIMTAYSREDHQIPKYRRLVGADWGDPADTVDIGSHPVHWVELEGCPIRNEIVMGTIDSTDDINLAIWNGITWGNQKEFTTTIDKNKKCFDIAYESQSGDALVVGRYDGTNSVRYNIWDGGAWVYSNSQNAFNLFSGNLCYLTMESRPGSDEILIAAASSDDDLQVIQWNGSAFNDLGKIEEVLAKKEYGIAEIAYEQQSGDALILWSRKDEDAISYRVWNGSTLGPEDQLPSFMDEVQIIRADADPTSDYIFVVAADKSKAINVAVWNGDAWVDTLELETSREAGTNPVNFDVAWENSGNEAVVVWGRADEFNIRYFTWQKGSPLSSGSTQLGPHFQDKPRATNLFSMSKSDKIILIVNNHLKDLYYCLWTGNKFVPDPAILLESNVGTERRIPFDIAETEVDSTGGS
jgi:hypothetical protein